MVAFSLPVFVSSYKYGKCVGIAIDMTKISNIEDHWTL